MAHRQGSNNLERQHRNSRDRLTGWLHAILWRALLAVFGFGLGWAAVAWLMER